jgi:hypothetical protein
MTDVIAMSQSCSKCGSSVHNDDATIRHPLDFLQALRERGWSITPTEGTHKPALCQKCASS